MYLNFTVILEAVKHASENKRADQITTRIRAFNLADALQMAKTFAHVEHDLQPGAIERHTTVVVGIHVPGSRGITYFPLDCLEDAAETIMRVADEVTKARVALAHRSPTLAAT